MNVRRAGVLGTALVVAALAALPMTAAQATDRAQTSHGVAAADSCRSAVSAGRAWMRRYAGSDPGSSPRRLRDVIQAQTDRMWDSSAKRAGLKIVRRLNRECF